MKKAIALLLIAAPLAACLQFDPQNAAGYASTAIRKARQVCSDAWAKPVPDETHWGARLVGDTWHIWLKDRGGRPDCALAMVTVSRNTDKPSDCLACPNL
jgi:hypothetical protein